MGERLPATVNESWPESLVLCGAWSEKLVRDDPLLLDTLRQLPRPG